MNNLKTLSILMLAVGMITVGCSKEKFINEPGNLVPKTVELDPSLPSIIVNGVMLHSEAFGNPDSPMVVVLHGGPGGDYRGLLNCKMLADQGYRVVFYDQRGSGLSQRLLTKTYTSRGMDVMTDLHNELSGVIAHYRTSPGQKVYLIGHSWGAIFGTSYCGKYPDAVQGLVAVEAGGLQWDDVIDYVSNTKKFSVWGELLNDVTYVDQFLTGSENEHQILDYKHAILAAENNISGEFNTEPGSSWRSGAVINAALFKIGEEHKPDFSAGITSFNPPVLFIHTENNKAYQDDWARKIASSYKTVQIHKVSGTGHSGVFADRSVFEQRTMPLILNYFKSL